MYVTIKRIKEREKIEVPNEFRVDGLKQTYFIILYLIVLLSALALVFASIITGQHIIMTLMGIVITIYCFYLSFTVWIKIENLLWKLKIKILKIFYKNQVIGDFWNRRTISFVAFFLEVEDKKVKKRENYPI